MAQRNVKISNPKAYQHIKLRNWQMNGYTADVLIK